MNFKFAYCFPFSFLSLFFIPLIGQSLDQDRARFFGLDGLSRQYDLVEEELKADEVFPFSIPKNKTSGFQSSKNEEEQWFLKENHIEFFSPNAIHESRIVKELFTYDERSNIILDETYQWDKESSVWKAFKRRELDFDLEGNVVSDFRYETESGVLEMAYRSSKLYNSVGNLQESYYVLAPPLYGNWEGEKILNFYNADGDLFRQIEYECDQSNGEWKQILKKEPIVNLEGVDWFSYSWSTSNAAWEVYEITAAEYSENGMTEQEVSTKYVDGNFSEKTIHDYNDQSQRIRTSNYFWNFDLEEWELIDKTEWEYDVLGNVILEIDYVWRSGISEFVGTIKRELVYDSLGNQLSNSRYVWDYINFDWFGLSKIEREFNSENNLVKEFRFWWPRAVNDWQLRSERENLILTAERCVHITNVEYEMLDGLEDFVPQIVTGNKIISYYLESGQLAEEIKSIWNKYNSAFEFVQKRERELEGDNVIFELVSRWNGTEQVWENSIKHEYQYDLSVERSELVEPLNYTSSNNMLLSYSTYFWNEIQNDWFEQIKYNLKWVQKSEALQNDLYVVNYKVFPNPAIDYFRFQPFIEGIELVQLFDMQGRLVKSKYLTADNKMLVSDLAPGMYYYLLGKEGAFSGKVIVQ